MKASICCNHKKVFSTIAISPLRLVKLAFQQNKYIFDQHELLSKRESHGRCVGSPVTIWSYTSARGGGGSPGACSPANFLIKMVQSGRSKVCYHQMLNHNFRVNKSTTKCTVFFCGIKVTY